MEPSVLRVADVGVGALRALLGPRGMAIVAVGAREPIPGSYWGASEAGLIGATLYLRDDTPVHSALHEAAHFLCMDESRRGALHTDAGGDFDEENAVCYLQVLLADGVPGMGRERMWADMDTWGYTFRLGSARRWFEEDAAEPREWLARRGFLDATGNLA